MATIDIQTALANEARRSELKQKIANLKGSLDSTSSLMQKLSSINSDNAAMLTDSQSELTALEAGAGPGITADYGPKSVVTQLVEVERLAGKGAVVDYVKANPACLEADAVAAWNTASLASHPSFNMVLQDGLAMSALYRANLFAAAIIAANTWEAQRSWINATPKTTIMTM